jgi:hypothetical protein
LPAAFDEPELPLVLGLDWVAYVCGCDCVVCVCVGSGAPVFELELEPGSAGPEAGPPLVAG